ncbi:hypothetical protein DMN91_001853 [Ooceraea biroi]|uniref:Protein FAM92A1 n=1 Tax=Ooceraea biroi TaxID=2015173 RepID=A0A3L8DZB5_OOCBI|nr:hypothetical protein DMN91_001853 [Ooceraea biroi]
MLRVRSQNSVYEQEAKFVQDRITGVEKHFAELCTIFGAFTRKAARLRDKSDELAKVIQVYGDSETINRSMSTGLANFSATLSVVGDYRDAEVQRLDAKSQAESELMKASVEVSRVVKGLEEQINSFERRKLHDLKSVLLDFVTIELSFHTKALELMTKAYQDIVSIDEIKDLEEFRETMRAPDSVTRLDTVNRTSFRHAYSLTNLANRFTSSPATLQKLANREAESADSVQTGFTNSSESVQVEEYADSTEETESESIREKPVRTRHKSM